MICWWRGFRWGDAGRVFLAVCFLTGMVLRGLNGWDIPSAWVQLSALLLILLSPLRQALRWQHLALLSVLLAWMAWRDWSLGYAPSAVSDGFKGALRLLGLLAIAAMSARAVLWPALSLAVPVCGLALLVYVGEAELLRALSHALDVAGSTGLQTPSYRNKLSVAFSLTCLMAFSLALSDVIWRRLLGLMVLVVTGALLLVNGGIGTVIGSVAAMALTLFLLRPRWLLPVALTGLLVGMVALLLLWQVRPDFFNLHVLLSGRDWILVATWPHLVEHGLLGAGSGYFAEVVTPMVHMPISITTGAILHPHSMYVSFLLAYGVVGLALLFAVAAYASSRLRLVMEPAGQALVGAITIFFLVYGIVDLRPLSPLPFAALLASGILVRSVGMTLRERRRGVNQT